ncbi:E3 ubiquitin-protein ligase KCMF1 [Myotis davidii]|uniref:E3 ubiquitin-protein ligase KCMF1 n=1 Tax=Myotis davidii TaxID=225400 RepID=L5LX68_MYODS|nr:E3 ubiquitin-protein ligase KCMF1 [Myotis davidii]
MSTRQLSTPGDPLGGRRHDCTFLDEDAGTAVTSLLMRADQNRPRRLHSQGPVTLLCVSSGALPFHVTVSEGEASAQELLSQLSGVRRSAGGQLNSSGPSASQLQQLQMQLQLERQHAQAARQQLETARNASRRTNTSSVTTTITQSTATPNPANTESSQQTLQNSQFLLTRLNDPKMSEAERQSMESERADRSLFVQELLLSTLVREESSSSDEDERGEMADFGAMGCVDIMPLDVALENLNLKESNKGNEPPPPPL